VPFPHPAKSDPRRQNISGKSVSAKANLPRISRIRLGEPNQSWEAMFLEEEQRPVPNDLAKISQPASGI
jgi:hypothetical protein